MTKKLILVLALVLAVVTASFATAKATDIVAQLDPTIKVTLNGKAVEMKSEDGQTVNAVVYNGTTYLPVRAISNALGMKVEWDQANRTVVLNASGTSNVPQTTTAATQTTTVIVTQPTTEVKTPVNNVVFKNDKIEVIYKSLDMGDDKDDEVEVKFLVKNLTNNEYRLTAVDTKVNGVVVASKLHDDEDIDARELEDVEIEFKKADLNKAGIKELKNIEFKFKLNHKTAPFETTVIKVNF